LLSSKDTKAKENEGKVYIGGRVNRYPIRAAKALVVSEPITGFSRIGR